MRQCRYYINWHDTYVSSDTMSQYCTIHMTLTRHTTMMPYYTVLCCYYTSRDHHNKKYLMMSPESLTPSFVNKQITLPTTSPKYNIMARGHQIENSTWEIYFRVTSNNDTRGALLFLGAIDFPVGFGGVHYLCDQVVHAVSAKWGHLHVAVRPHRRCNFLTLLWRDRGTVENLSKVEKHVNNALYNGISSYEQIWCLKKRLR